MKIYCMRHAEAVSSVEDQQRPLADNGKLEAEQMSQFFIEHDIEIAHIMHSEKLRSIQTAQCFLGKLGVSRGATELPALARENSIPELVSSINSWQEDTLLVGHLPYIAQLVGELVANQQDSLLVNFSPATVVCLEKVGVSQWVVDWVVSPVLLRHLNA